MTWTRPDLLARALLVGGTLLFPLGTAGVVAPQGVPAGAAPAVAVVALSAATALLGVLALCAGLVVCVRHVDPPRPPPSAEAVAERWDQG
jgi:hypothetical protein